MIVSLLVCNWSAAMLSSAIYLKVERWKKKTPIFDDDTDNHNDKWCSLNKKNTHLGSSELSASFFVTWSTLLASLGGFIGNVKTLSLTLTLALSCTWLLKSSGMLLVTPKAIQKIYTKNLKIRENSNKTWFFASNHRT